VKDFDAKNSLAKSIECTACAAALDLGKESGKV